MARLEMAACRHLPAADCLHSPRHVSACRPQPGTGSPSPSAAVSRTCLESLRIWPGLVPLILQNACLPTSQPPGRCYEFLVTRPTGSFRGFESLCYPSSIECTSHWTEFLLFVRKFGPVHRNPARAMGIRNTFVFQFFPAAPVITGAKPDRCVILHGHLGFVGSPWAGCAGWVVPLAEQRKCFCACLRLGKVHGQVTAPAFFSGPWAEAAGPQWEKPRRAGLQLLCLVSLWSQGFR